MPVQQRKSRKQQRRRTGLLLACLACIAAAAAPQEPAQVAEDVSLGDANEPNQRQDRSQVVFDHLRNHQVVPEDAPKPGIAVQAQLPHATAQDHAREGVKAILRSWNDSLTAS